jgi:hypothetical protein
MIQIPRSLTRTLWAVFRKLAKQPVGANCPVVTFRAEHTGLQVRLHNTEVRAAFDQAGSYTPQSISLPAEVLADCAARGNGLVTLDTAGNGKVQVRWEDADRPQVREYESPALRTLSVFPSVPAKLSPVGSGCIKALRDAGQSAAREATRYAFHRIQLRGRTGQVIATDGGQLLVQSGFRFPFTQDVLIPYSAVFGCKELSEGSEVALGYEAGLVVIQAGAWTLCFPLDRESRYPRVEEAIPAPNRKATTCRLGSDDVALLNRSLPQSGREDVPLTLDLNGQAIIRVRIDEKGGPTEVLLPRTKVSGVAVRIGVSRALLMRALELGFVEFSVIDASTPIVCRDEQRTFVFMPLSKEEVIPPKEGDLRIASEANQESVRAVPERKTPRPVSQPAPSEPTRNDVLPLPAPRTRGHQANGNGMFDPLAEAAALKDVLRDAYTRTHQLIVALQRQKKTTQAVRTALGSLRQLEHLSDA